MSVAPRRTALNASMALASTGVVLAGIGGWWLLQQHAPGDGAKTERLLLAPMVSVIEPCILSPEALPASMHDLAERCQGPQGSAAALIESTLETLQPQRNSFSREELGYTLPVPLLRLFQPTPDGSWRIDEEKVGRLVRTLRDTPRPAILYLFSTHFSAEAPVEAALAADPGNMGHTRDGPLGTDDYYDSKVFNWTFASTTNTLTQRRVEAIQAVLEATCRLPASDRARIRGVTLLGELHHLFPNFQAGMGFDGPYRVTDYSAASVHGFQEFLESEFGSVEALNRALGSDYRAFSEVEPPSRDIRTEPLRRYTEHMDSFAHGTLPISGWAHVEGGHSDDPTWVHVYRNGRFAGKTEVRLGRQDVLAAKPEFGDANTGWRMDLDFSRLPAGIHQLDIFLEARSGTLTHLGRRDIAIMDRQQSTPQRQPQQALPPSVPAGPGLQFHVDSPRDASSYYYNPLVTLWHAFRARQVVNYLDYFDRVVSSSCLAAVPRYTHQIVPFTNPGWDENKFAIQASLQPHGSVRLGVSLYGEPTYGRSYFEWLERSGHTRYGITEFHPLKALNAASLRQVLDAHARHGADFLSFFAEPRWHGALVPRDHNIFSFDPDNPKFGSDRLYRSTQQSLAPVNR